MNRLKNKSLQECSLRLREFIDAVPMDNSSRELLEKRKRAELALDHMQRITAGGSESSPCGPRPRIPDLSGRTEILSPCGPRPHIP